MPDTRCAKRLFVTLTLAFAISLPSWAIPTVDDFLREQDVRDMELSPDGTHLAIVINKDGKRTVIVRNITEPDMPVVGVHSDDIVRPNYLYWGNNDRLLIVLSVPYGTDQVRRDKEKKDDFDINDYFMFSRIVAVDKDMANSGFLMEDEARLRSNISLSHITNFLPNDADNILMSAYRKGRRTQYRVNIMTGGAEMVTIGSPRTYRFLNDDDGKPLYRFDYLPRSRAFEIYEHVDDEDWRKVDKLYLDKDNEDSIDTVGLVALYDDDLVYRKRNEDTGFYELLSVNRETGETLPLVSLPDQDVGWAVFNSRDDQIIGYTVEKDYVRQVFFDEDVQADYDAIAEKIGDYNFAVSGLSRQSPVALVRSWGPDDPLSYHLWNFETGELTFLADAFNGRALKNLSLPAIAAYRTRDGVPIRVYILLPNDYEHGKTYPTIILPHGGPQARSRASYDDFAQFLSTRGYIVVQPNFRGSVGYGRDFEEAGYKQWGGTMQDDLTDAVNFMIDQGYTNPDKVCIVGASYGGYAALMGAIRTPSLYKCAISLSGVTNLTKLIEYDMKKIDEEDWQKLLFDRIGDPQMDREMLDNMSPALHADKISIPVMLVAGTDDDIVPFSQARMMDKALKKAGADYEFIALKDTGHNPFYFRDDKEQVLKAVEAFLEKNLK